MIKGALQSKKANIHKSNNYKSNQIKCWFLRRGENRSTRRKTSRSRVENQQTQPTYDAKSGNRTRATLVEGECSTTAPTLLPQVVETSVKVTTNSPSQDYTHPDDHNLRTYDMTPGFKPFTILRSFGRPSERLANNYISYASNVRRIRQQLWFNHRCKDLGLVPAGLRLKSPLNTKEAIQIVKATCRRLIRARINDCHRRLNFYNNKLQQRLDKLKQLIPTNLLDTVLVIADKRADKTEEQHRNQSQQKLTRLQRTGSGIFLPVL